MMVQRLVLVVLALALVSCGGGGVAKPPPTSTGNQGAPLSGLSERSAGSLVAGVELPGRLLFVQEGTIWLWQGAQAQPWIGAGESWQPAWSPDGEQIAFVERGQSYSNIMLADADGDSIEQVTYNGSELPLQSHERIYDTMWAFYPTWSPGGRRITLATQYGPPFGAPAAEYNLEIYSISTSGGARRRLYGDEDSYCGPMVYRPAGTASDDTSLGIDDEADEMVYELVFTRVDITPNGFQQLYIVDLNRAQIFGEPFPGAPEQSYDPAFSPDGEWLAFAASDDEGTDIWALPGNPATGSRPRPQRLTSMGKARAPVFSPDGTKLAFLAIAPGKVGFDLWVADVQENDRGVLQAGKPQQVTRDMFLDGNSGLSWTQ